MKFYAHISSGDILSKEDWLSCYSAEELNFRGFETAEAAFVADVRDGDLIEVEGSMNKSEMTAEQLKAARAALGMTQAELAAATGYSRRSVEHMEQGTCAVNRRMALLLEALQKTR